MKTAILFNSIFSNTGLGIDLGLDDVTPNDAGDSDTGTNNLQNFPVIRKPAITADGDLVAVYSVDSTTGNATYPLLIEFFEAYADEEEDKTLLGSDSYPASSAQCLKGVNLGNAARLGVSGNALIVATATDARNNTSEFSQSIQVGVSPPVSVPGLTTWGIIAMSLLMAVLLVVGLRKRLRRDVFG